MQERINGEDSLVDLMKSSEVIFSSEVIIYKNQIMHIKIEELKSRYFHIV